MTCSAILVSWLTSSLHNRLARLHAAQTITRAGGWAVESGTMPPSWMETTRPFHKIMLNPLGIEFRYVELGKYGGSWLQSPRHGLDDTTLKKVLPALRQIENQWLGLQGATLSSEGYKSLAVLEKLRGISLADSNVTDQDLSFLDSLTNLRVIELNNTAISDDGIDHVRNLPLLEKITICGTKVTPEKMEELKRKLPRLQEIW